MHRDCFATPHIFMACLDNIWAEVITLTLHFLGKWEYMRIFFSSTYFYPEDSYIKTSHKWGNNTKVFGFFTPFLRLLVKVSQDKCFVHTDLFLYKFMCPNNYTGKDNNSFSHKKWTFMNILAPYMYDFVPSYVMTST